MGSNRMDEEICRKIERNKYLSSIDQFAAHHYAHHYEY